MAIVKVDPTELEGIQHDGYVNNEGNITTDDEFNDEFSDDVWVQKFDEVSSSEKAAIIFKLIKRCPSETMNLIKEAVDDSRGDGGDDKEEDEEEEDVEEDEVLEVVMVEDSDGGEEGEGEEGEEDEENDGIIDIGE
ncbi:6172_t:CDS:2, partial [Entrophospora sp. SA101]